MYMVLDILYATVQIYFMWSRQILKFTLVLRLKTHHVRSLIVQSRQVHTTAYRELHKQLKFNKRAVRLKKAPLLYIMVLMTTTTALRLTCAVVKTTSGSRQCLQYHSITAIIFAIYYLWVTYNLGRTIHDTVSLGSTQQASTTNFARSNNHERNRLEAIVIVHKLQLLMEPCFFFTTSDGASPYALFSKLDIASGLHHFHSSSFHRSPLLSHHFPIPQLFFYPVVSSFSQALFVARV